MSEANLLVDQLTEIGIHRATPLAWLKTSETEKCQTGNMFFQSSTPGNTHLLWRRCV